MHNGFNVCPLAIAIYAITKQLYLTEPRILHIWVWHLFSSVHKLKKVSHLNFSLPKYHTVVTGMIIKLCQILYLEIAHIAI